MFSGYMYHEKIFVPAFFKVSRSLTYLITLSLEKEIIVLEKSLEKSWIYFLVSVQSINGSLKKKGSARDFRK